MLQTSQQLRHSRRHLLTLVIPASASMLRRPALQHLHQLLHRVLWTEKLLFRRRIPKILTQTRLDRARMHGDTHGALLARQAQVVIETLTQLRHPGFRRSVREPASLRVVVAY